MTSLVQTIWGNDWIFYSYGLNVVVSQISMTEQLLFFPCTDPTTTWLYFDVAFYFYIVCYHDKAYNYCQLGLKS